MARIGVVITFLRVSVAGKTSKFYNPLKGAQGDAKSATDIQNALKSFPAPLRQTDFTACYTNLPAMAI